MSSPVLRQARKKLPFVCLDSLFAIGLVCLGPWKDEYLVVLCLRPTSRNLPTNVNPPKTFVKNPPDLFFAAHDTNYSETCVSERESEKNIYTYTYLIISL